MTLSNKVYDVLKALVTVAIPACTTFYVTLDASFTANPSVTGCTATIITGDANNSYKNNVYRLVRLTNVTNGATLIQGVQFGNN